MNMELKSRDLALVVLCIALVATLALLLKGEAAQALDRSLLDGLHDWLPRGLQNALLKVYQLSGVGFTGLLVAVSLAYLALKRWWRDLGLLVVSTGGILAIVDLVLKPLFDRSRPPEKLLVVEGHSFPSGHAAGSVAFYFAMVAILAAHYPQLRRPLVVAASVWIALVWFSTLVARAHWPSDLLAGGAVGTAWLTLCLALWRSRRNPQS
ncbi:MAG: phosphatase PAP2 family protein [Cyanobacteria bacterium]|nr:phosphatase PAP2 family protein [Cyanobacteriota bacterium]